MRHRLICLAMLLVVLQPEDACACGSDWSMPKSHFEGVDYQGYVYHVEKIGELQARDGLNLPIYLNFSSRRTSASPYAGYGWEIPLLEAKMVQMDENNFRLEQPDGWFRPFWRDKKDPSILHASGWKAEIRGDIISAWADCGTKLVFQRGRLISMQIKDRKFDYVFEGGRVQEIREGSATLLRVESDPLSGEVTGLSMSGDKRIALERSERPRVQVINGQALVGGMEQSLSKVTMADGTTQSFEYAVDEKLNPTMKFDGERLIVWSPANGRIIRDGQWTYDIKPGVGASSNAAIGRTDAQNKTAFWHLDNAAGKEIVQGLDGVKKVTNWFTSGKLAGSVREILSIKHNQSESLHRVAYDENGLPLRIMKGEMEKWSAKYDENGRIVFESRDDGWQRHFQYRSDGKQVETINIPNGSRILRISNSKGSVEKIVRNGKVLFDFSDS